MNKRIKCGLAILLVLIIAVTAVAVLPSVSSDKSSEGISEGAVYADVDISGGFTDKLGLAPVGTDDPETSTQAPTGTNGEDPTEEPKVESGTEPATEPVSDPTAQPTEEPTVDPASEPTEAPTEEPATDPGTQPAADPTAAPVEEPATEPDEPTNAPTEGLTEDPTFVGAVTTVTRTTEEDDQLGLSWEPAASAKGYHIYWRSADDSSAEYVLLTTVKSHAITIRNLKAGAMYEFKIAAYKTDENNLYEGEGATYTAGTTPVGVSNFRLTSGAQAGTVMKWDKNNLCDGYRIYRQYNGSWSEYKTLSKDVTEFRDTNVTPGEAYNYKIYTYRNDSAGALTSTDYSLLRTVCGLRAPTDNGTMTILRRVHFKWKAISFASGYEIYYSSDNKDFTLLTETTNLRYDSNRFKDGKQYYFRLYPYKLVGANKTKVYGTYTNFSFKTAQSAYGKTAPKTYIEVSLDQQHMWYYIDDDIYVSTDVVTGNYGSMDTPKGYWAVNNKASPCTLVGANYTSYVQYWMSFIGGSHGIHDASWRSSFGGTIYKGNGSHGCINTPLNNVKKMYAKVTIGTPVIIY